MQATRHAESGAATGLVQCLGLPELDGAQIRVWPQDLDTRVSWVAVIEWPVENFVSPHDLVLTTGIGCDEAQLCEMVRQIADSGGTAILICTGRGAIHESIGDLVVSTADTAGIALIEVPWRTRFSDISRAVVTALYGPRGSDAGALPAEFTRALLGSSGVDGVAETLEQITHAAVVVVDDTMGRAGCGRRGRRWFAEPGIESRVLAAVRTHISDPRHGRPHHTSRIELSDGSAVIVCPATAPGGLLGWVIVDPSDNEPAVERALAPASTAVAIELVRRAAAADAGSRGRERFLWQLARGAADGTRDIVTQAVSLGFAPNTVYTVGMGVLEELNRDEHSESATTTLAADRLRRHPSHPSSVFAVDDREVLVCLHADDDHLTDADALPATIGPFTATFGFIGGRHSLSELADAVRRARQVVAVVRAVDGPGATGHADRLRAYLLLQRVATDPDAQQLVNRTLAPLERADQARQSQLVATLAAFIEANGNTASAARALFLNRHSLIYRLHKIRELTGLDVNDPDDRATMEISLRVRRLQRGAEPNNLDPQRDSPR